MPKPIIELRNVSKTFSIPHEKIDSFKGSILDLFKRKSYTNFKALSNVCLEVQRGEFLGIVGKNGSGKSTLLKILAGIYEPDSGEIIVRGKISPFLELGVGFNGELTAKDNIYLNATILGLSEKQIDKKFNKIIDFSELGEFVDTKVKNFSSGMYARLAFSVAIEADADIYLMDEVLAVGDLEFQSKCFDVFKQLIAQEKTIILVSHDIQQLQEFCDTGIFIQNGITSDKNDINKIIQKYV
jgi:ABC-type polysaccharide/polyol phosphate transport system ATPase subunit